MSLTIKKILVPIDFSEISLNAVDYAAQIADAQVTLLHVMESYQFNAQLKEGNPMNKIFVKGVETAMQKIILKHLEGISAEAVHREGKTYQVIDDYAKEGNFDLIVMGTHGVSGIRDFKKFMLGSNAYRVVHSAECPVITVREKKKPVQIKNILLPLDITKETTQKVGWAAHLAKMFDAKIHVVSVSTFFEEFVVNISQQDILLRSISELLKNAKIPHTVKIIKEDNISKAVMDYGEKINADLIVIMTRQEDKWEEMMIGGRARAVITQSKIPVLSVNPSKIHPTAHKEKNTLYREKETIKGEFAVKETLPFYYRKKNKEAAV